MHIEAAGASGMNQNFSDGTQVSISVNSSSFHGAGEEITLTDGSKNVLVSFSPQKKYNSVILSTPDLKTGETYTVSMGNEKQEITPDSLIYGNSSGNMGRPGGKGDRGEGMDFPGIKPQNRDDIVKP